VPRKNPVPEFEKAASRRFREARRAAGFTQAELARRVEIDSSRLRNYENFFARIPFWIGARIAAATDHNQRWLALGTLPKTPFFPVELRIAEIVPEAMPFTEGYARLLRVDFDIIFHAAAESARVPEDQLKASMFAHQLPIGSLVQARGDSKIETDLKELRWLCAHLVDDERRQLVREISKLRSAYTRSYGRRSVHFEKRRAELEASNAAETVSAYRSLFDLDLDDPRRARGARLA
jgi:transcriptional regulator with XRE-family HTH domain